MYIVSPKHQTIQMLDATLPDPSFYSTHIVTDSIPYGLLAILSGSKIMLSAISPNSNQKFSMLNFLLQAGEKLTILIPYKALLLTGK